LQGVTQASGNIPRPKGKKKRNFCKERNPLKTKKKPKEIGNWGVSSPGGGRKNDWGESVIPGNGRHQNSKKKRGSL